MSSAVVREDLAGHPAQVAPRLLNLVIAVDDVLARIVEVKAYAAAEGPASHAYGGPTARNTSRFGPPGTPCVYRSFGQV